MSTAEAIDDLILGILLDSPHGRAWLERRAEAEVMGRRLLDLRRSGLDSEIVEQMWTAGDTETIDKAAAMTPSEIEAVNRAWRARRP